VASYRKLPSGLWQATVYLPGQRRITHTDKLLSVVKTWALKTEARVKSGDKRDPRAGRITVQEWHDRWWQARVVADTTAERDRKNLDRYVLPHWGSWPLEAITRMEVEGWVKQLGKNGGRTRDGKKKPLGAPTIHLAYMVLSSMLKAAVREHPPIIMHNPCTDVSLPPLPPKKRRYFTEAEIGRILDALIEPYRTMAELSMWSGLRWEELAGLHGRDVDWLRGVIPGIAQVSTPAGLRPHPKSERSDRVIPVPAHVVKAMSALMQGRGLHEPVFLNARGRPVNYKTWYWHWKEALTAAKVPYAKPHTCRDTAASSLLHDGVLMFEVQQILGHESIKTTEKYSHHDPNAHAKIKEAWNSRSSRTEHARAAEQGDD
jgi:integrase